MVKLMSSNMGKMTNTGDWSGPRSDSLSVGIVDRNVCLACKKNHKGKPNAMCSRIKQQMYLRGEI